MRNGRSCAVRSLLFLKLVRSLFMMLSTPEMLWLVLLSLGIVSLSAGELGLRFTANSLRLNAPNAGGQRFINTVIPAAALSDAAWSIRRMKHMKT